MRQFLLLRNSESASIPIPFLLSVSQLLHIFLPCYLFKYFERNLKLFYIYIRLNDAQIHSILIQLSTYKEYMMCTFVYSNCFLLYTQNAKTLTIISFYGIKLTVFNNRFRVFFSLVRWNNSCG